MTVNDIDRRSATNCDIVNAILGAIHVSTGDYSMDDQKRLLFSVQDRNVKGIVGSSDEIIVVLLMQLYSSFNGLHVIML